MSSELIFNTSSRNERRDQIINAAGQIARERIDAAHRASAAATRDLRNKLRLVYRVPYHEWERALASGPGAVVSVLERYAAQRQALLTAAAATAG